MRREERRDGIRAAITLKSEISDEARELGKRLPGCTIEGRIEIAERLARRALEDAGLPTVCGTFKRHADGSIERVADDTEQVVFEDIPTVVDLGEAAWVEGDTGWRLVEVRPRKVEWAPDPASWRLVGLTELAEPAPSITHDAAMLLGYAAAARDGIAGDCDPVELARRAVRLGGTFEALRLSIANGWPMPGCVLARAHPSAGTRARRCRRRIELRTQMQWPGLAGASRRDCRSRNLKSRPMSQRLTS
jgi:hypothetical protein